MKYLRMAESIATLFPKKTEVQLIHAESGEKISTRLLPATFIPAELNKPMILEIEGMAWRIVKAEILRQESYLFKRRLKLHVIESSRYNSQGRVDLPTVSGMQPELFETNTDVEIDLSISAADWLQHEFLPGHQITQIQEEINEVENIKLNSCDPNPLLGFKDLYSRKVRDEYRLNISLEELKATIDAEIKWVIFFDNAGRLKNGFVLSSLNNIFYGITEEDNIISMGMIGYESAEEELLNMMIKYRLVLVDWCEARIFLNSISDEIDQSPIETGQPNDLF